MRQLHTLPHSVAAAERQRERGEDSLRERWQLAPVATEDNGVKNEIISKQNDRTNEGTRREGKKGMGSGEVSGQASEQ